MAMMQMMMAAGPTRTDLPTTLNVHASNPGSTAVASVELTNAGVLQKVLTPGGTSPIQNWIAGGSAFVSQYEARWTTITGSLTSGTVGTWQALSTSRAWSKSATGVDATVTGTLEIRWAAGGLVFSSCAVTLEAAGGT